MIFDKKNRFLQISLDVTTRVLPQGGSVSGCLHPGEEGLPLGVSLGCLPLGGKSGYRGSICLKGHLSNHPGSASMPLRSATDVGLMKT